MPTCDILILGGGIAGLATAWHLGQGADEAPRKVVLLEAAAGLGRESSGRAAGILRSFIEDPVTAEIARRGAEFLRRPPRGFCPTPLLDPVGLLLAASGATAERMRATWDRLASTREIRELPRDAAHVLAPHLRMDADLYLHLPREGRLDLSAEIEGFARATRALGVEVRTRARVTELLVQDERVTGARLADGSEQHARTTVLAAGGWAGRLGRRAGSRVTLQPTKRHLLVTARDDRIDPRWPVVWLEDRGFYCKPDRGGLLVTACDETAVDPDLCERDPVVLEVIAAKIAHHTPAFAGASAADSWCGMRTLTADGRFVLGFDPGVSGLFWVAGLGGHGMTAGPELGRLAARLLRGDTSEDDLALLNAIDPGRPALAGTTSN